MKASGEWVIVCKSQRRERTVGNIIVALNSKPKEEEAFEALIVSVGKFGKDFGFSKGDYIITQSLNAIKVGTTKAGEIYAVDCDDIICSLEEDDGEDDVSASWS